jgi:putative transposase
MVRDGVGSERGVCRATRWSRTSARYERTRRTDASIEDAIKEVAADWPRFGYRRVRAILRREKEIRVSGDRVLRMMQRLRLTIRPLRKQRVKDRPPVIPMAVADRPDIGWAFDFTSEQLVTGERIRIFTIIDECTREVIDSRVAASFRAHDVRDIIHDAIRLRSSPPRWVRSDNGPEFMAGLMRRFFEATSLVHARSRPGKPTDNARIESFHARFRDEFLDRQLFSTVQETQEQIDAYRQRYNHRRPHSSLNYSTPAEYAATFPTLQ